MGSLRRLARPIEHHPWIDGSPRVGARPECARLFPCADRGAKRTGVPGDASLTGSRGIDLAASTVGGKRTVTATSGNLVNPVVPQRRHES